MDIHIIGSIDPRLTLERDLVARLLKTPPVKLRHGDTFTGRPGTTVHADEVHVLKLHPARETEPAALRLETERSAGVHQPAKTWFEILHEGEIAWQGNIMPRLEPLHLVAGDDPDLPSLLAQALQLDLDLFCEGVLQLDFSPSNFARDEEGTLYYLDDDFYPANDLSALLQSLGVLIRQYATHLSIFEQLGNVLGNSMQKCPRLDTAELQRGLGGLFLPEEVQQFACNTLLQHLRQDTTNASGTGGKKEEQVSGQAPATPRNRGPRILLLSDIHANLPALEGVIMACDRLHPDEVLVMGDIVGYGPHPSECVALLAETGWTILQGNHDHAAAHGLPEYGFSSLARWALQWTREQLCEESRAWLASLPGRIVRDDWMAVHGAPVDEQNFNAYVYHLTYGDNLDWMQQNGQRLCFHGHTHVPAVHLRHGREDHALGSKTVELPNDCHALVCPGSVGQTRTGQPGAWMALLEDNCLSFECMNYDWQRTARDMQRAGFPDGLIQRILTGH